MKGNIDHHVEKIFKELPWGVVRETLSVYYGVRNVALIPVEHGKLFEFLLAIESLGLLYLLSQRLLSNENRVLVGNYSFQSLYSDIRLAHEGRYQIYILRDKGILPELRNADNSASDLEIGRVLGYPVCCRSFFCDRFNQTNSHDKLQSLLVGYFMDIPNEELSFLVNPFVRFHGKGALPYYSCSLNCEQSLKFTTNLFNCILEWNQGIGQQVIEDSCGTYSLSCIDTNIIIRRVDGQRSWDCVRFVMGEKQRSMKAEYTTRNITFN